VRFYMFVYVCAFGKSVVIVVGDSGVGVCALT
jgi:hypothetical protein